ncbi:hypothetical protein N7539_008569 [Penicillium diatomitis]|uniref:Uncharacterized protein n=1 Tax=Penicillium diatomitis TaxID=2819901 RepID=A0A9W9WQU4_9EURO|nr:uncharacterized protein N7539_008569 [Penicillium diatomitis]KAJ5472000.1 hypothetical protein N7539_008569 [Penicillium diatomitis]
MNSITKAVQVESRNTMNSAIDDWQTDDEQTIPTPGAHTPLFERKDQPLPPFAQSILTQSLSDLENMDSENIPSPSTLRRLMFSAEEENDVLGKIRPLMLGEREGNSSPVQSRPHQVNRGWPRGERLERTRLDTRRCENTANDQSSEF